MRQPHNKELSPPPSVSTAEVKKSYLSRCSIWLQIIKDFMYFLKKKRTSTDSVMGHNYMQFTFFLPLFMEDQTSTPEISQDDLET